MVREDALHRLYCAIVGAVRVLAWIRQGYAELVQVFVAVLRTVDRCGLLDAVVVAF